ncbi:SpoIIE family protein phosphatase [Tistrella bauzanensis]
MLRFHSLRVAVFLGVALILGVTAGVILPSTTILLERSFVAERDREARNTVDLFATSLRERFQALIRQKVDTVEQRKRSLEDHGNQVVSVLQSFRGMAATGRMSETEARNAALDWLVSQPRSETRYILVYDSQMRMLVHPDIARLGQTLLDGVDMKGRPTFAAARADVLTYGNTFSTFERPSLDETSTRLKFGFSAALPLGLDCGDHRRCRGCPTRRRCPDRPDDPRSDHQRSRAAAGRSRPGDDLRWRRPDGDRPQGGDAACAAVTTGAGGCGDLFHMLPGDLPRQRTMGIAPPDDAGDLVLYAYLFRPLDWRVALVLSRDDILGPAHEVTRNQALLLGSVLVLSFLAAYPLSGLLVRPLRRLEVRVRALSSQDFTRDAEPDADLARLIDDRRDEIGRLAGAFAFMDRTLREKIRELIKITEERMRIEGELAAARDIQEGLLPKTFPPFPGRPEINLNARLISAKEVGGDLFDFFFAEDRYFYFVVGDVSGKGVPAALFMAITRTLLKTSAEKGLSPAGMLAEVNDMLARDNPNTMFVTLFCGRLDLASGRLEYCNAGHNPPLLLRKGQPGSADHGLRSGAGCDRGHALSGHGAGPHARR